MILVDVQDIDPYTYISVKGSRECKACHVLDVRRYVRGIRLHYDIIKYSEM